MLNKTYTKHRSPLFIKKCTIGNYTLARTKNKRMKKIHTSIYSVVFVALAFSTLKAQEARPASDVYSMMVFNFTKYIQWPDGEKEGEFVIGVIGENETFNSFKNLYGGKTKANKKFLIKYFNNASEISDCHVLFIDHSKSNEFEKANTMLHGKPTLIVTDHKGYAEKGSAINFKTIDNKLRFEINQQIITTSKLKISSTLTSMAILI
ncbi:MAG: hypothetical protein OJF59_001716 [Cytophagales bacterium]|jgi:hypothetical protein|nr:MAG: hypothetical protein OJF59_001716 [Cytophagales bacterium]